MSISPHPKHRNRDLLVIPTFNCAPQIGGLIEALAPVANFWGEIWFVDNGSTDGTVEVMLKKLDFFPIHPNPSKVFINSENIGLGGTHKIVFKRAIEENFATLTIFHGDHQAIFEDAVSILSIARSKPDTFILGSRFSRSSKLVGYSRLRTIFNYSMNTAYSVLLRRRISDLGSGLNTFPVRSLQNLNHNNLPNDLTFNIEFLKWLIIEKKGIIWHPITWIETDQISNVNIFSQIFKTLKLAILPFGLMGSQIPEGFYQRQVGSHEN